MCSTSSFRSWHRKSATVGSSSFVCSACAHHMRVMACSFQYASPMRSALMASIRIRGSSEKRSTRDQKVKMMGLAVSAATRLLRLLSINRPDSGSISASVTGEPQRSLSQIQDVVDALKADYDEAYFLTGKFTRALYADDCYFADPTISFTGTNLYERNLKLLNPFLEDPSLTLFSISKEPGEDFKVKAVWQLRTRLKFPWRPVICVAGSTIYTLNEQLKVASHVEIWSVSVFEALSQMFRKGDEFL